jgi:hypothetical protein
VVEFGIVAITFTLIMFAIADFGLLLNDWITVSSGVRGMARDAAVGRNRDELFAEARGLRIPGVTGDPHFGAAGFCCDTGAALVVSVAYYDQCTPGIGTCNPMQSPAELLTLDNRVGTGPYAGNCNTWNNSPPLPCAHPAPPRAAGSCGGHPTCPGDSVVVTLTAAGAQVITPLVRPFFTRANECPTTDFSPSRCYVPLSSTVTMRFEGSLL